MEFEEVVRRRKMIRAYEKRDVEDEKIMRLLRNAHRAPSAGHLEPQEFIVVRDEEVKDGLARAALDQEYVREAPVLIVVCSDTRRVVWRYGGRGVNFYSIVDGAFASMLILLSAVNEGLGACFVGAFDDEEVSRVLKLPNGVRPIGIICLGYPAEKPPRLARRPLKEKIHYDTW